VGKIQFEKYQGTGNDFVIVDNWDGSLDAYALPVSEICDRRFGVGADGLIVIQQHDDCDFEMIYFNADGSQSFCGNGSRCAVRFVHVKNRISDVTDFLSTDGMHKATVNGDQIALDMHDVEDWEIGLDHYITDTGSPHYMVYVDRLEGFPVVEQARQIRFNDRFSGPGINVNFLENHGDDLSIRTYERGVENETLSCGTGVTASAIMHHIRNGAFTGDKEIAVESRGGGLKVSFHFDGNKFTQIKLIGPAEKTFEGQIDI